MARPNRYAYRSSLLFRCYSTDGETLLELETYRPLEALLQLTTPGAKTSLVEVYHGRAERQIKAKALGELKTLNEWNAEVLKYRETLRGQYLMNTHGSDVFWDWAAEQILLGKPPKATINEGMTCCLDDLHKMHRRAQQLQATLDKNEFR